MPHDSIRPRAALAAIIAAIVAAGAFAAPVSMKLEDQFGRAVDLHVGDGRTVVAIVSDLREAAEEIAAWEKQLGLLPSDTVLYRVANLKAIPFFVPKGSVTKDLKDNYPAMSLALDWKGELSSALGAPKKATAVLVFGPDGAELGRATGGASQAGAASIKAALSRAGR